MYTHVSLLGVMKGKLWARFSQIW